MLKTNNLKHSVKPKTLLIFKPTTVFLHYSSNNNYNWI